MFGDKFYKTKIIGCAILILLACGYASVEGPHRNMTLRKFLEHPEHYVGQELTLPANLRDQAKDHF